MIIYLENQYHTSSPFENAATMSSGVTECSLLPSSDNSSTSSVVGSLPNLFRAKTRERICDPQPLLHISLPQVFRTCKKTFEQITALKKISSSYLRFLV